MSATARSPIAVLGAALAMALALAGVLIGVGPSAVAAAATAGAPFGNFESARAATGGIEVKGWAVDPDTTGPIYVWVTIDGLGRHLYAGGSRPDVGAAYPGSGSDHGFSGTLAAAPGTHAVCVTASNVGPGAHTPLGCRSVTVSTAGSPFGNFESARGATGGIEVKGWAIDPDTTGPIYVWVTIDGVGRHLYANASRPDVGAANPGSGSDHGFTGTVAAGPGSHTVCVTASNVGPGAHTSLGCRSVTVAAPYCGITWGSLAKQAGTGSAGPDSGHLTDVRTGQHPCFDRLVIDIDGPIPGGYLVFYSDSWENEETGEPISLRGGARLRVIARVGAYAFYDEPQAGQVGHWTYAPTDSNEVADVSGYRTLRQITFGGDWAWSYVDLGVRARLPFRVFVLDGPGSGSRLVVDVAHSW